MTNYNLAVKFVKDYINDIMVSDWSYHGVIDITEILNFHEIADMFNLTQYQYDLLINKAQALGTKKLATYNPTTGFEMKG